MSEFGAVQISPLFSLANLAPCKFHRHFLSRNWRRANFTTIFPHEIGAMPISTSFSLTKLASCQFHHLFPSRNWRRANFNIIFPHEIGAVPISPNQKYRTFSSGIIFLIKIVHILLLVHVRYHLIMLSVLSARHARTNLKHRLFHVHILNICRYYQY